MDEHVPAQKSKKFWAYVVGNVVLLVLVFTGRLATSAVAGVLTALNLGYWGAQGAVDLGSVILNRKNGGSG